MVVSNASTPLYPELMFGFYHKFVAEDNATIAVLICQVMGDVEEFFHNP